MRRAAALIGVGAAVAIAAGLVQAQTPPQAPPTVQVPETPEPADPIADALARQDAPPTEEAPPAPGEVTPPDEPEAPAVAVPEPRAPETETDNAEPAVDPALLSRRVRHQSAIIQAIDKITAERLKFEVKVGQPVRYKGLVFNVRACETTAPDEPMQDSIAYVEVRSEPRTQAEQTPSRRVFRGWMYARSPSLNPLEHNVYDAWLISCRDPRPVSVGGAR
jgi:hypothetical protein